MEIQSVVLYISGVFSVHAFGPFSTSQLKIPLPHTFNIFNNVKIILSPTDLKFFQPDHEITGQTKVHLRIDSPKLKIHFFARIL